MYLPPPQGSDGFPGALGAAGEKGKKVSRGFRIMLILCSENQTFSINVFVFCGITQGPAGQPGGAGQRGPNVSAVSQTILLFSS